jgi:ribonuclease HII
MGTDLWAFEKKAARNGFFRIAGIDEAGRGPLAGPVVSAAVILPDIFEASGITDSKKLSPKTRERFYHEIYDQAVSIGIGIIDPPEIDRINILNASLLSMSMAVKNLLPEPDYLIVDGIFKVPLNLPQEPIIKGDMLSVSVACASIVAKVTRDRLMDRYHQDFPQYEFLRHKGYPTQAHKAAILKYGCCYIHRRTFKGVSEGL